MGLSDARIILGNVTKLSQAEKKRGLLIENTEIVVGETKLPRIGINKSHNFSTF